MKHKVSKTFRTSFNAIWSLKRIRKAKPAIIGYSSPVLHYKPNVLIPIFGKHWGFSFQPGLVYKLIATIETTIPCCINFSRFFVILHLLPQTLLQQTK